MGRIQVRGRAGVVGFEAVIVGPKKPPLKVLFRWDPDLVGDIKRIAASTGRSINEAGESLMRSAVVRSLEELERGGVLLPAEPKKDGRRTRKPRV